MFDIINSVLLCIIFFIIFKDKFLKIKNENVTKDLTVYNISKKYYLTPRETEIIDLAISGLKINDISEKICRSQITVRKAMTQIYKKMNVKSINELTQKIDEVKNGK